MWAPVLMMLVLGSVTSLRITPDTQITHLGSGDKKVLNCFGSSSSAWWGEYNLTYVECGTRGGIDDKVGIYLHYMFGRFYLSILTHFQHLISCCYPPSSSSSCVEPEVTTLPVGLGDWDQVTILC